MFKFTEQSEEEVIEKRDIGIYVHFPNIPEDRKREDVDQYFRNEKEVCDWMHGENSYNKCLNVPVDIWTDENKESFLFCFHWDKSKAEYVCKVDQTEMRFGRVWSSSADVSFQVRKKGTFMEIFEAIKDALLINRRFEAQYKVSVIHLNKAFISERSSWL